MNTDRDVRTQTTYADQFFFGSTNLPVTLMPIACVTNTLELRCAYNLAEKRLKAPHNFFCKKRLNGPDFLVKSTAIK